MKKIGIFSGSFNPVHIGHLALANWMCEFEDLSEVWFVITPQNPLKSYDKLMDYELRYKMVSESTEGYPKFRVSDFEKNLPRPSYTIDTMHALREAYPGYQFQLMIGADSWENINMWKDGQLLLKEFPVLIYPRKGYEKPVISDFPLVRKVQAPVFEISSSYIREAIKSGKDVRFFLPEPVRKYINYIKEKTI